MSDDFPPDLNELLPLAEQGDAEAQIMLGQIYRKGEGVPQDYEKAVNWYTLAAEQGDADAQFSLGVMHTNGQGVSQDDKTALKWYTLAAEQGHADAQFNMGWMYGNGLGVPQDNVYAYMWGEIAASNGHENGIELRDLVAKVMTADQIEKAGELSRQRRSFMDFDIGTSVKIVRSSERFWVEVTAKSDDGMVTGMVNNALVGTEDHGLDFGDEVKFHESEILDVFTSDTLDKIAAEQMAELKAKGL